MCKKQQILHFLKCNIRTFYNKKSLTIDKKQIATTSIVAICYQLNLNL